MRFRGSLILLVLAAAFAAFYYLYVLPSAEEKKVREELAKRFFRINAEAVEFFRIANRHGTFNIGRDGTDWKLTQPLMLPADREAIEDLLTIIRAGKIVKIISTDAKSIAEFGLERPRAVLFIGYEGTIDELALGGRTPAGTGTYAFARGIQTIFVVDPELERVATLDLYALRSKNLFAFSPDRVKEIRVTRGRDSLVMSRLGEEWHMITPFAARASGVDILELLTGIAAQRADEFYDNTVPEATDYKDTIKIFLSLEDDSSISIDVHFWGTAADEGLVAYQHGMKYSGRLARDFWNFIGRDASDFRYRNLFQFDESSLRTIRIKRETESLEIIRKGDTWYLNDQELLSQKMTDFIWFLRDWKAERFPPAPSSFPAQEPSLEIELLDEDSQRAGLLSVYEKIEGESMGFREGKEYYLHYAISDNLQEPCAVSGLKLEKIPQAQELTE